MPCERLRVIASCLQLVCESLCVSDAFHKRPPSRAHGPTTAAAAPLGTHAKTMLVTKRRAVIADTFEACEFCGTNSQTAVRRGFHRACLATVGACDV